MYQDERRKNIIKDLDHAFELALIIFNIILAIIIQYVLGLDVKALPMIIENISKLTIAFILPVMITLVIWIIIHFIDNETWKMRLRTFAWSSIVFLIFTITFTLLVVSIFPDLMYSSDLTALYIVTMFLIIPIIPLYLVSKVLNRYKKALNNIEFFTASGKSGSFKRYLPFLLSWGIYFVIVFRIVYLV